MTNTQIHHANLIVGVGDSQSFVFEILKNDLQFDPLANPDFLLLSGETFGIDEARALLLWSIGKPLAGEKKVCLVQAKTLGFEAQNALLKTLEEPTFGTYIFISVESLGGVLPTFISRVRVLSLAENSLYSETLAKRFLSANIKEKLKLLGGLAKKENKSELKEMLNDLEEVAYQNDFEPQKMKDILKAKILVSARGASPKMVSEWLACVLN